MAYDLKELIRWIVLSEPYALSSQSFGRTIGTTIRRLGEKPQFSHFYLRQMRAEELYESLLVATAADQHQAAMTKSSEKSKRRMAEAIHHRPSAPTTATKPPLSTARSRKR